MPGARMIAVSTNGAAARNIVVFLARPAFPAAVDDRGPAILRDVSLKIKGAGGGPENLEFEGTARGDAFERMRLKGTIDLIKGSITLEGELSGLNLSENFRRRVPREARPLVKALALNNGVVDIELKRFRYDPTAPRLAA